MIPTTTVVAPSASKAKDADKLQKTLDAAFKSDDPLLVAKAQLEVNAVMLQYLQQLDWKIWELYNKYGK